MKKTLEDELMSLAHRILHLRGREDLEQMKKLTGELYEKLSILSFAEKHFSGVQPTIGLHDVAETLSKLKNETIETKHEPTLKKEEKKEESSTATSTEQKSEKVPDQEINSSIAISAEAEKEVDSTTLTDEDVSESKKDVKERSKTSNEDIDLPAEAEQKLDYLTSTDKDLPSSVPTSEDFENSVEAEDDSEIDLREISVHFDDLPQFEPISLQKTEPQPEEEIFPESPDPEPKKQTEESSIPEPSNQAPSLVDLFPTSPKAKNRNESTSQRRSLNERLNVGLSFGLNDRLAFINNLFNGNAEDFNRVISQLNSFEHYSDAQDFIEDQVKPDYDWEDKITYEERFLQALEQRMEE